jgi:2-C-methyl-D-erythritol 4-phosphate cytidylyltransferase / 2-C-methyl-D-erythritol 2,4-cyclodiphosphate synthase
VSVGVIIVAAGRGQRMGGAQPKQLLDLAGRSMLQRSVDAFDGHPAIAEIVVVLPAELVPDGASLVGETKRVCRIAAGGERRQDSVRAGVQRLSGDVSVLLIHDAARPFADAALIDRVIAGAYESGAAVPAVPARDTVKRVPAGQSLVAETIPRADIWLAQTPQGFRREVLQAAMRSSASDAEFTDEAMLAERAGYPVRVVPGDDRNVKITTPDDLSAARARWSGPPRVGTGYDLHRLVEGRPLVLAGVVVPYERGPLGHSDGDVVCHALTDALLGATGGGDIGQQFPDTDPAWKDAPGLDLLARTAAAVRARGFSVTNVDVTVILERPKLAPHTASIRQHLASVLGLAVDAVSVKGKTNEGVDAVGRGEAIAAHAVVSLTAPAAATASESAPQATDSIGRRR